MSIDTVHFSALKTKEKVRIAKGRLAITLYQVSLVGYTLSLWGVAGLFFFVPVLGMQAMQHSLFFVLQLISLACGPLKHSTVSQWLWKGLSMLVFEWVHGQDDLYHSATRDLKLIYFDIWWSGLCFLTFKQYQLVDFAQTHCTTVYSYRPAWQSHALAEWPYDINFAFVSASSYHSCVE